MTRRSTRLAIHGSFNQHSFNEFILQNAVITFSETPIRLSAGRDSYFYVNWRRVTQDVYLTELLINRYVLPFVRSKFPGTPAVTIFGVPEGATKLGVLAQAKWAKTQPDYGPGSGVLAMGRGKPKEHGDVADRQFVGIPRTPVVVLEDEVTTGDSLIKTIMVLLSSGIGVKAAIALTSRNEKTDEGKSVAKTLEENGIVFYALSNALELLPKAIARTKPSQKVVQAILAEFDRYGERRLVLQAPVGRR